MKATDELHDLRQRFVTAFEEYEAAVRVACALPISQSADEAERRCELWELVERKRQAAASTQDEYEAAALEYERPFFESGR